MGSINAQQTAYKVLEKVSKGQKVIMGDIVRDVGYAPSISIVPNKVTNTLTYRKIMEEAKKPLIERLDREINEVTLAINSKKKNKEDYRTLIGSLDILIKNKHLLSGGITSLNVFVLPSEVMARNDITANNKDDGQG